MTDIGSASWNETDASNNTASPAGAPEGMAASGVNDTIRAIMGGVRRFFDHINPTVFSAGSANAQTLTYNVAPAAYVFGEIFCFFAGFTNTAAATLDVNALGAKAIVNTNGSALNGGEIQAGDVVEVAYDNTSFRLLGRRRQVLTPNNGVLYQPGGFIEQWGFSSFVFADTVAVLFPDVFPTAVFGVFTQIQQAAGGTLATGVANVTGAGFDFNISAAVSTVGYWRAIGN